MEPFAHKSHFSAPLAREVQEVHKSRSWKQQGYKSFEDWGKAKVHLTKSTIYKFVKIIEYFGHCPDEEIESIGPETCHQLARRSEKDGISPGTTGHDDHAPRKELRARLKAELRKKAGDKAVFGESIDPSFRWLEHAPINEQGVVFLFGMVSQELGFRVQGIRQRWPDCIAKQKTVDRHGKEQWREVRIEFEYTSKDFYTHGHSPECTEIVCWEDNLSVKPDGCPQILELKSAIEKLRKPQ